MREVIPVPELDEVPVVHTRKGEVVDTCKKLPGTALPRLPVPSPVPPWNGCRIAARAGIATKRPRPTIADMISFFILYSIRFICYLLNFSV